MCTACRRGYATKTCKKICPGYDGKNDDTICSGNGVCNFGIEGTGRCMCGGKGGVSSITGINTNLYKDQDFKPHSANDEWCNIYRGDGLNCNLQPYCYYEEETSSCISFQYNSEARPSVAVNYPIQHEYPYYVVKYRQFSFRLEVYLTIHEYKTCRAIYRNEKKMIMLDIGLPSV